MADHITSSEGVSELSSPIPLSPVIELRGVSKSFPLFKSPWEAGATALGLHRLPFVPGVRRRIPRYAALKNIDLKIFREERVGVIGRNGAGKTTLLRLITNGTPPTSGAIAVSDGVDALFDTSVGFFPEFSGYDNIVAGMRLRHWREDIDISEAVKEVVDFVELGDYLHQPIKNYSKGMRARLAFAVATSIRPDIVVIDEVLGAGDAYFSAKAARRMRNLLGNGCTLLLVSHSISQVLQFCDRVIWIERGEIVKDGKALDVSKAYEEFIADLKQSSSDPAKSKIVSITDSSFHDDAAAQVRLAAQAGANLSGGRTPHQQPNGADASMRSGNVGTSLATTGGVSRWKSDRQGLEINRVWIESGVDVDVGVVETGHPMDIVFDFSVSREDTYATRYVVLFLTLDGRWLSRQVSGTDIFNASAGDKRRVRLHLESVLFGSGTYLFSLAIYHAENEGEFSSYYDLLSRSFEFKVINPVGSDQSIVVHPAVWSESISVEST